MNNVRQPRNRDERRAVASADRKAKVNPDTPEVEESDLCFAFHAIGGGMVCILADEPFTFREVMIGQVFCTQINTGFFSYHVTATVAEICQAMGLDVLGIGQPPPRDPLPEEMASHDETMEPEAKRYAFTDEPLPVGHPSAKPVNLMDALRRSIENEKE